jgi:hypothetical protein
MKKGFWLAFAIWICTGFLGSSSSNPSCPPLASLNFVDQTAEPYLRVNDMGKASIISGSIRFRCSIPSDVFLFVSDQGGLSPPEVYPGAESFQEKWTGSTDGTGLRIDFEFQPARNLRFTFKDAFQEFNDAQTAGFSWLFTLDQEGDPMDHVAVMTISIDSVTQGHAPSAVEKE